jgi:hypothetical protein
MSLPFLIWRHPLERAFFEPSFVGVGIPRDQPRTGSPPHRQHGDDPRRTNVREPARRRVADRITNDACNRSSGDARLHFAERQQPRLELLHEDDERRQAGIIETHTSSIQKKPMPN